MKVGISWKDWAKMVAYCRSAKPTEIMGLAHVQETEGGLYVYDPFILKQKVGPATCEMDQRELALFIGSYPDIGKLKCIWHSHVEMSAFFSTCDRGTSEQLAKLGKMMSGASSYFLSLVLNCKEEYQAKVDQFKPFELSIPGEIYRFHQNADYADLAQEVKDKLTDHTPPPTKHYGGWRGQTGDWPDDVGQSEFGDENFVIIGGNSRDEAKMKRTPDKSDDPEFDEIFTVIDKVTKKEEEKGPADGPSQSST